MSRRIYLDAAARTPIDPLVLEAMLPVMRSVHGNPDSSHWAGAEAKALVDEARERVSSLAHSGPASTVFVSGATEANALAIRGLLDASQGRRGIVSCVTEHPAVLEPLRVLAGDGVPVRLIGVDEVGRPDLDELRAVVDEGTLLVTMMAANNETGAITDLSIVADIAHEVGALFHTDASQLMAWGSLPADHGADLITVSSHKMHGPQGVGALIIERESRRLIRPVQHGGGQERGLRSGTVNVAGVVGLGRAAELAAEMGPRNLDVTAELRDRLQALLQEHVPLVLLNGPADAKLPGILNVAFGDTGQEVEAEAVLARMPNIAASTGSACHTGVPGPSPVLIAMGLTPERAQSSLRFSLSRLSVSADVDDAVPRIVGAVKAVQHAQSERPDDMERLAYSQ